MTRAYLNHETARVGVPVVFEPEAQPGPRRAIGFDHPDPSPIQVVKQVPQQVLDAYWRQVELAKKAQK